MRVLIIGCGYVGLPLGKRLADQGHHVTGLRRSRSAEDELRHDSITPLSADIANPAELRALPRDFDWVVNLVSSGRGGAEEYQRTYVEGTRCLLDWLAEVPVRKYVYTSSTSVYGQTDGMPVDEGSPATPASATGRILRDTEELLLAAWNEWQFPAVVLRVAGIYGPGRGHLFQRFMRGEAALAGSGERILNMIHLEDLVEIIIASLEKADPGQILNVADDEPVSERQFYEWLAARTGKKFPKSMPEEEFKKRKRGLTSKRVQNARLKNSLSYQFRFPTYREGYDRELARWSAGQE